MTLSKSKARIFRERLTTSTSVQEERDQEHLVPHKSFLNSQTQAAEEARASAATTQDACRTDGVGDARDEWEGAEIVVIGEGGRAEPGRRKLEWCGTCGAHVLHADMEVGKTTSLQ